MPMQSSAPPRRFQRSLVSFLAATAGMALAVSSCDSPMPEDAGIDAGTPADASPDGSATVCERNSDCDDGAYCNGDETCLPGDSAADARGCVAGESPCLVTEECLEESSSCRPANCDMPDADIDNIPRIACGGSDCDDDDVNRYPGNIEVCDAEGHDEDCDDTTFGGVDADGDGFVSAACCNGDACGTDCDDSRRDVHPDAVEVCNAVDDDCDGSIDGATAFCPAGMCRDQRCRDSSWERVYSSGGGSHVYTNFLVVDANGNAHLHIEIEGLVDLDRDGTDEPAGDYIVSFAANGAVRWAVPISAPRSLAVHPDGQTIFYLTSDEIVSVSGTDGTELRRLSVPPLAGRTDHQFRGIAFSGAELVVGREYIDFDVFPFDLDYEVALLSVDGTVLERRLFDTDTENLGFGSPIATNSVVVLSGRVEVPYSLEAGVMVEGNFVLSLDRNLQITRAVSRLPGAAVDVSGSGALLLSGEARGGYIPFWGGAAWDVSVPDETCTPNVGGFVLALSPTGEYLWHRLHSGPACDYFSFARFDGRGGVAIAGMFSGEMDIEPRGRLSATGREAFYIIVDEEDGGRLVRDAHLFPTTAEVDIRAAVADRFGGLLVSGTFALGNLTLPSGTVYDGAERLESFIVRISDIP